MVDGHEAVLAFFAISGFYMALILDTTYKSARTFYMSRFLTLYPMYALALAASVALLVSLDIHPMTTLDTMKSVMSDPAGFAIMTWTSLCLMGQELLFSLSLTPDLHFVTASREGIWQNAPLIQAWSLSLEAVFYALAPMLTVLKTRTLAGLAALSLAGKLLVMSGNMADVVFYKRFFPVEFWLFACGILAYRCFKGLPKRPRIFDYLAFGVLAGSIFLADLVPDAMEPFALPLAVLFSLPFAFRGFRRLASDRIVGRLSYPFYLFHFSVIAIFETYMDEPPGWAILGAALAVAMAAHVLFTPGIERLKQAVRTGRNSLRPAVNPCEGIAR